MDTPQSRIISCGDVSCEFLVDPIPRPKPAPFIVNMMPTTRKVVLVDNRKPNSITILKRTAEILRERGIAVDHKIRRKPSAGIPMDDAMLDDLAAGGGLILCGVSD
jgi:hypothetical protein